MKISIDTKAFKKQCEYLALQRSKRIMEQLALHLQDIRRGAIAELIPNMAVYKGKKVYNPRWARKLQPSVPGKLTSRTEKLRMSLEEKADTPFFNNFTYTRTERIAKLKTSTTTLTVRHTKKGKGSGTIHAEKNYLAGFARNRYGGMPIETMTTMRIRYMWELGRAGIRGQKRPFLNPAANKLQKRLESRLEPFLT